MSRLYLVEEPKEYRRGDGKAFWRPAMSAIEGGRETKLLGCDDGWFRTDWDLDSTIYAQNNPKLYRSRKRALRVAERAVAKRSVEILYQIKPV